MASLRSLIELLSESCNDKRKFVSHNGKQLRIKISEEQKPSLEHELNGFGITYQIFSLNNECEIELGNKVGLSTIIFFSEKEYLNRLDSIRDEFDELNLVILRYEGGFLIKEINEKYSEEKSIFFNAIEYQLLVNLFGKTNDFTSFWDKDERRFLIFSGDKGLFFLGYHALETRLKLLGNLAVQRTNLESSLEKIDFVQFFKDAVIQGVHEVEEEHRFFEMIKSLQILIDIATRDHAIYLRKFGFDKIKAKFKEERIKYFESIEKNIDSVSKQVTSFPLTFAASIFAGYQVKDKSFILFLILGAYFLYTIIAWRILDVVAFNRKKIGEDVSIEEQNIQTGYQMIYDSFKPDFDKIKDKIRRLKGLIQLLRAVLVVLLIGFGVFCYYQYTHSKPVVAPSPMEVRIIK